MAQYWNIEDSDRKDVLDKLEIVENALEALNASWWILDEVEQIKTILHYYMKDMGNPLFDEDGGLRPLSAGDNR